MPERDRLDWLLRLTDWFHGHWEDPDWGRLPTSQILIAVAIRDLASGIQDEQLRSQLYTGADKVVAKNSQLVNKT